jgi:hypothetical protein
MLTQFFPWSLFLISEIKAVKSQAINHRSSQEISRMQKNAVFWDITPCGSRKSRRFGGTYRLHHQGEKNERARDYVSSN